MSVFHLSVVTPDRMFFDGDVERVIVRTVSGDVGILKGHAKYISALGTGAMKVKTSSEEKVAAISGGFIKVDEDKTLILASVCEWEDEIDLNRAKAAEQRARQLLQSAESGSQHDIAELKLKRALNRIHIAE